LAATAHRLLPAHPCR